MPDAPGKMHVWPVVRTGRFISGDDPALAHLDRYVLFCLIGEANGIAGIYGEPVWLVGSALRKTWPRDYDLRVLLPDPVFAERYGGSPAEWEDQGITGDWQRVRWCWSDDCVKRSRAATTSVHWLVDVQVYPERYWQQFANQPRVRLDTRGRFAATITETEW